MGLTICARSEGLNTTWTIDRYSSSKTRLCLPTQQPLRSEPRVAQGQQAWDAPSLPAPDPARSLLIMGCAGFMPAVACLASSTAALTRTRASRVSVEDCNPAAIRRRALLHEQGEGSTWSRRRLCTLGTCTIWS